MDNGSSGGFGLLGVVIGAVLVIAIAMFFFNSGSAPRTGTPTAKIEVPAGK